MQRNPSSTSRASFADREPEAGEDRLGKPQRLREDEDDDDDEEDEEIDDEREIGVSHRINPLPLREEEAEELSEADIMEELDMEELDADDLAKMDGPDA